MKTKKTKIKWTLHAASVEFGVARETIMRGLRQLEIDTESFKTYSTKQIYLAIAGDLKAEKIRGQRLVNEAMEREAALAKEQLYDRDAMDRRFLEGMCLPLRATLESMPESLAPMVNPGDPAAAKKVLREWLEKAKASLREPEKQPTEE